MMAGWAVCLAFAGPHQRIAKGQPTLREGHGERQTAFAITDRRLHHRDDDLAMMTARAKMTKGFPRFAQLKLLVELMVVAHAPAVRHDALVMYYSTASGGE